MIMDDIEWEAELGYLVGRINSLQAAYDRVYESVALPASIRAADDAATWPLTIGQHAQYCLVQAIDMCQGIADLVTMETGLQIPIAATHPLARAAIESASMAIWMTSPTTRRERVVHRLQAAHAELVFEKAFIHAVASGQSPSQQQEMQRAHAKDSRRLWIWMKEIARANDIEDMEYVQKMPGWQVVVEAAAPALPAARASLLVAAWRFTSGLTHPSFIRGRVAHTFVQTEPGGDKSRGEVSANIEWLVSTASVAEALTRKALVRLQQTKAQVNEEHPVPALRRIH
ncbi:hypothetical protein [Arthrobacter psychrochitiniphilus]|nr:hypothetical protein [Arthrobacter psychrochitiniphilus]NYG15974.1 hypothetical protein [Arthrobacter psychrochitiniphilus]